MKNIIISLIIVSGILLSSCVDLDTEAKGIVTEDALFSTESGVVTFLATEYAQLPLQDLPNLMGGLTYMESAGKGASIPDFAHGRNADDVWNYELVRQLNEFLENIDDYESIHPTLKMDTWKGEVKFMQAFQYFLMARHFAGVPIITETQTYDGTNLTEILVPRNTEKEVWDYILTTVDEAIALLPETNQSGRACKYAALALKSRAMLYAGSIAEYGELQLDGLIGIAADQANVYYQHSLDASNEIIANGGFSLYSNGSLSASESFTELFLESDMSSNSEVIFLRSFEYPYNGHSLDRYIIPASLRGSSSKSSYVNPSVRLIEMYDRLDGSSAPLDIYEADGVTPKVYAHPLELFADRDPRLTASVIVPGSTFLNQEIEMYAGTYTDGTFVKDMSNKGADGVDPSASRASYTGFLLRKYSDYRLTDPGDYKEKSNSDWIEFRYAEVLLNLAEAAEATGDIATAKAAINQVRDRVGMPAIDDADITAERVQKERTIELAFESHNLWDIKRWRTAATTYTGATELGLFPYKNTTTGEYIFEYDLSSNNSSTFTANDYWEQIPGTDSNNLVQNPN